ncbi:MAG: SCP2 sterol-binding domain-containing protein [Marinobacter sp.]|nr:SCP2 sterol-binding domain-containing protein [Marinobacter sp.]
MLPGPSRLTDRFPLLRQTADLLRDTLPSPAPLIRVLERSIPLPLRQTLSEEPLNRLFAEAIAAGDFAEFEGRTLRLEINPGYWGITLGFWQGRLRFLEGPGEATIRGSLAAFRVLAQRKQDPDQLFFQRKLVIEGDTELGLAVKNLLDSLEWQLPNWLTRWPATS